MILLIEPSRDLAKTVSQALKNAGLECVVAHNSEQAIKLADQIDLEAVVIELLIPRHNGLEFVYEFRSYSDWLGRPIIVYSQLSNEELGLDKALQREMGIVSHLYKPTTSLETLIGEIKAAIKNEPA